MKLFNVTFTQESVHVSTTSLHLPSVLQVLEDEAAGPPVHAVVKFAATHRQGEVPLSASLALSSTSTCSQLDPEQADALRRRLGRARRVKLYLLQQSGSNSFLVAGDEKHQKYKVNIGPQVRPPVLLLLHLLLPPDVFLREGSRLPPHPLHHAPSLLHPRERLPAHR